MKAAFYDGPKTLRVAETTADDPGPGQVQLQVAYCGICGTDMHIFHGHMDHRVKMPQVIGHEASGVIVKVGEGVDGFQSGDHVTVMPLDPDGDTPACRLGYSHICEKLNFIGIDSSGAFQQFWNVPAFTLHKLPGDLSLKLAALIEPLAVACHDVRLAEVQPGEFVVVIGGGPIGMLVALVAQAAGARVVLSELDPFRLKLAEELGLKTVNPAAGDLVKYVFEQTEGAGADVVFEVSGAAAAAEMMTELPRVRGRMVVVAIYNKPVPVNLFKFFWRELRLIGCRVYESQDFDRAIEVAQSGSLPLDRLISGTYSLDNIAEAFARADGGGDVMKVLVECAGG